MQYLESIRSLPNFLHLQQTYLLRAFAVYLGLTSFIFFLLFSSAMCILLKGIFEKHCLCCCIEKWTECGGDVPGWQQTGRVFQALCESSVIWIISEWECVRRCVCCICPQIYLSQWTVHFCSPSIDAQTHHINQHFRKIPPILNLFHVSLPRSQITSISTDDEMNAAHIVDKDISLTLFSGTF